MEFECLTTEAENLTTVFAAETGIAREKIRTVASPYRICPLGAHIDHQGGPVLGMTINAYTILAYVPTEDGTISLRSLNYPGNVAFHLQCAENIHIGLNNGILDQTSIVFGRKDHLLHIGTQDRSVASYKATETLDNYHVLIACSGYSRELTTTGYNSRVKECRKAARLLYAFDKGPPVDKLGDISEGVFQRYGENFPHDLCRRATHFFTICETTR